MITPIQELGDVLDEELRVVANIMSESKVPVVGLVLHIAHDEATGYSHMQCTTNAATAEERHLMFEQALLALTAMKSGKNGKKL